jgi:hypothetical protein
MKTEKPIVRRDLSCAYWNCKSLLMRKTESFFHHTLAGSLRDLQTRHVFWFHLGIRSDFNQCWTWRLLRDVTMKRCLLLLRFNGFIWKPNANWYFEFGIEFLFHLEVSLCVRLRQISMRSCRGQAELSCLWFTWRFLFEWKTKILTQGNDLRFYPSTRNSEKDLKFF